MIRITNEIDGKKYELVPRYGSCEGCVFKSRFGCTLEECRRDFNYRQVCKVLLSIWKEVKMAERFRWSLQRKEPYAMPNTLGNCSFPVHTYRWKDIMMSDDRKLLEKEMPNDKDYRIEDMCPWLNKEVRDED